MIALGSLALPDEARAEENPLRFGVDLYLWLPAASGDVSVLGINVPVDVFALDIADDASSVYGFHGRFFAEWERWRVAIEPLHGAVEFQGIGPAVTANPLFMLLGPLATPFMRTSGKVTMVEASASYALLRESQGPWAFEVAPLLGFRYTHLNLGASIIGGLGYREKADWADPIMGARAELDYESGWTLAGRIDFGGFGAGADFTWSLLATAGYAWQLGDVELGLSGGYRALDQDYSGGGGFGWNMLLHGPIIGVGARF